jgi:hypothetical protein
MQSISFKAPRRFTEQFYVVVTFETCNHEVLGCSSDRDTGYPEGFREFPYPTQANTATVP